MTEERVQLNLKIKKSNFQKLEELVENDRISKAGWVENWIEVCHEELHPQEDS